MKKSKIIIFIIVFLSLFFLQFGIGETEDLLSNVKAALDDFERKKGEIDSQGFYGNGLPEAPAVQERERSPSLSMEENLSQPVTGIGTASPVPEENPPPPSGSEGAGLVQKAERGDLVIDVLDLKDMDIQDFLKLIAKKSGLNIVAGVNVRGRVTIYLKDVDVYDALRIILEANDLAYIEENNIIKVLTAQDYELRHGHKFGAKTTTMIKKLVYANALDMVTVLNQMKSPSGKIIFDHKSNTLVLIDSPKKVREMSEFSDQVDVPIETEVFSLSYAQAKELSEKINEVLTANLGRAKFDDRSNKIVVTDTRSKIEEIGKIIRAFDVKEREVLIEAKIIQIVLSDEHKMGVDWDAIVSNYHS
ncbi:MAG: secretin N-terminal domain-containing protein, partial [Candidatus Omnitrophota bacterium]